MTLARLTDEAIAPDLARFYDDVARRVDAVQPLMYRNPNAMARFERVLELAGHGKRRWTCLELGCAEGMMTQRLAKLFLQVDAVDVSRVMLDRAPYVANVRYFRGDVETWQPARRRYDVVVMSEIVEHLHDPQAALRRYAAMAGRLIVTCPVTEPVNDAGAFDATLIGREQRVGDATGHIWYMDMDGFLSLFAGLHVLHSEQLYHQGIAVCESVG